MREIMRKARPWAAVLFVSSFLVACDGDDDPSGPEFSEEEVQEVAGVAESVTEPFEAATQVQANLFSAYLRLAGLGGGGGELAAVPFSAMARMRAPLPVTGALKAPSAPEGVLIPDEFEGMTFVWDLDSAGYVLSDQAGAPEDGVRFLWYAVDPFSGEPVQPLNELGHLDLVDASTESAARLEVIAVSDADGVIADYFVRGAVTGNLTQTTVTITSEGFFADGDDQLDFDMEMISRLSEESEESEHTIELDGEDGSITLHVVEDFTDELITTDGTFTVEGGGNEAVFSFEEEITELDATVEGALTFNGEEVVVFEGESENPEFTRPDGSDLTADEIEALAQIWYVFGATYLFAVQALLPFFLLLIFAGF